MKQLFTTFQVGAIRLKNLFIGCQMTAILLAAISTSHAQSPGGVTGAMVWLKANSGTGTTTNASAVTSWTSQPGAKNFIGTATYYDDAANLANWNPVVRFNGTNDVLINSTVFGADPVNSNSTFLAAKILGDATSLTSVLWGSSDANTSNNRLNVHLPNGGTIYYDMGNAVSGGRIAIPMAASDYNTNNIWTFRTGTVAVPAFNHQIFRNGSSAAAGNGAIGAYSLEGKELRIGSSISNTQPWAGNLFETIVYEKDLTTLERQQVETYLAIKYGKTLPFDYVTSDGSTVYSVAGYENNIAGVGRDDTSLLLQKQSQSSNPGDQVIMSLNGAPQATNAANAGAIGLDRRYIIWGDNNLPGTSYASNLTNVNDVFNRWWKVENAGSISQAVTLLFPASAVSAYTSPRIVRNATGSATSAATYPLVLTPITINGVDYFSYATAWAPGASYFTFGGCLPLPTPSAVVTQPTCSLATGTITIDNPITGQTYSFDNGATYQASNIKSGLTPGVYQIMVKDGCGASVATSVTVQAADCCTPAAGTITLNP
ncbi:hypothetical protein L0657_25240 [Dyadobacter sp. CY345]|uniref:hypothetical protein n=1 Tax=Dyadobacter sp. CY345 TaxID=2909335 RepID=UPI001F4662A1|nr:hypothetical protein [Dyadobacter sp. CY345]MCF2447285.1 hypothetical protein [Dyadobacter sp. CY345]